MDLHKQPVKNILIVVTWDRNNLILGEIAKFAKELDKNDTKH